MSLLCCGVACGALSRSLSWRCGYGDSCYWRSFAVVCVFLFLFYYFFQSNMLFLFFNCFCIESPFRSVVSLWGLVMYLVWGVVWLDVFFVFLFFSFFYLSFWVIFVVLCFLIFVFRYKAMWVIWSGGVFLLLIRPHICCGCVGEA